MMENSMEIFNGIGLERVESKQIKSKQGTLHEEKARMRKKIISKIKKLPKCYTVQADDVICENLIGLPEYQTAKTIFCFASMPTEVNTRAVIEDALQRGKRICVPKCIGKGTMEVREITDFSDLQLGFYGIMEPKSICPIVQRDEIDLGIIPGVTCNKKGERLGHGGGYYDRFLKEIEFPTAILCRERIMESRIPMMKHDVRIQIVITESGVWR